jgi:hypothetical protein
MTTMPKLDTYSIAAGGEIEQQQLTPQSMIEH